MTEKPQIQGVLETSLYVDNLERSAEFYQRVLGFEPMLSDDRLCALKAGSQQVLLLFRKGASNAASATPGGVIPPHDGSGQSHLAFAISKEQLSAWEEELRQEGINIESRMEWPRGGRSLYFRDPDGHLVELVTPGTWPVY
jgi:catechol 2,3-dioxygenase-like lactoylglutathione lyase family enzyme